MAQKSVMQFFNGPWAIIPPNYSQNYIKYYLDAYILGKNVNKKFGWKKFRTKLLPKEEREGALNGGHFPWSMDLLQGQIEKGQTEKAIVKLNALDNIFG